MRKSKIGVDCSSLRAWAIAAVAALPSTRSTCFLPQSTGWRKTQRLIRSLRPAAHFQDAADRCARIPRTRNTTGPAILKVRRITAVVSNVMRFKTTWIALCVVVLASAALRLDAQRGGAPVPPVPGAQGAGARGGRGGGQGASTQGFPAQQRPPGDAALIAKGNNLYGVHCRACHGADLRGG